MPIWKPKAESDRQKIIAYIREDSPQAALNVGHVLLETALLLDKMPMIGRVGHVAGTRELVALPNYIIIYRVVEGVSEILRIKHAATQY
jgi:addiction module RelE/StbE family toxin